MEPTPAAIARRSVVSKGLLLAALLCSCCGWVRAEEEVPEWVVAGIAAVETGSVYRDNRLVLYRDRRDGADGEVGPWQLSPSVLRDMRLLHQRDRARTDSAFSEKAARQWLLRCLRRADNDWDAAVAIYHTGPKGSTRRGRLYAERVRNAGMAAVAQAPALAAN